MGAFSYRALNPAGKTVKGIIEGDSERQVRGQLRSQQLKPLVIQSTSQKETANSPKRGSLLGGKFGGGKKLNTRDLSLVTRQLASLVQSGLPLDETIRVAAKQSRKEKIKSILLQVRSGVVEGRSLAQSLGDCPKAFDHMYRAMVRAGESAGFLGAVLERLAEYTETSQATKQRLQMALIYPVVLLCVSLGIVGLLMAFVVPKLVGIFENRNADLPALTKALIAGSNFINSYWGLATIVAIIAAIVSFSYWLRDDKHRLIWHRFLLRIPFFNELLVQTDSARFSATLAILIDSGVPLLEALRIAGQVLNNLVLRQSSEQVAVSVQEGSSLHRALDKAEVFPPLLVQMVASGEANGTLSKQLTYASRNQERELEMTIGTFMGLMEPLTVVFMGGLVFIIMLAIMLPIFNLNKLV